MDNKKDANEIETPSKRGLFARMRSNFLTGVIFIAPLALTIWFIWWAINFFDSKLVPFVPDRINPNNMLPPEFGFQIPGVGLVFFLILATVVGALTKGLVGRQLSALVKNLINRFPVVRSIYNALQQILETVFADRERSFQNACLVEYPRKGIYAIGFIARHAGGEVPEKAGETLTAVFVPTTPNPTSGFLLYFPTKDIKILDMTVEEAAKMIISSGLVEPERISVAEIAASAALK